LQMRQRQQSPHSSSPDWRQILQTASRGNEGQKKGEGWLQAGLGHAESKLL
jgi:hypothetical protein